MPYTGEGPALATRSFGSLESAGLKQGEADFDKASRISPRDQDVASNRVLFYCSTKQYAKAEQLLEQAHLFASYREWHLPKITEVRLLQGNLEGAARSIYAVCLDDPKARAALPQVLVGLEEQQAKAATNLLREWSDQEGETGMSLGLAKNCAQLARDSNHLPVAQRFLTCAWWWPRPTWTTAKWIPPPNS